MINLSIYRYSYKHVFIYYKWHMKMKILLGKRLWYRSSLWTTSVLQIKNLKEQLYFL